MKPKKCKVCKCIFQPARPLQYVCGWECASDLKTYKPVKVKKPKVSTKTLTDHVKDTQIVWNKYVRVRDNDLPCVSCGEWKEKWHAGHYMATSIRPQLRFHPDNVWKQCLRCNVFLRGNLIYYRKELLNRIGETRVDWLEGVHEPAHFTIDQLVQIKADSRRMTKELEQ